MDLQNPAEIGAALRFLLPGIPILVAIHCARGGTNLAVVYAQMALAAWLAFESALSAPTPVVIGVGAGMAAIAWLAALGIENDERRVKRATTVSLACVGVALVATLAPIGETGFAPAAILLVERGVPGVLMIGLLGIAFHALYPALDRTPAPRLARGLAVLAFSAPALVAIEGHALASFGLASGFLPVSLLFGHLLSPRRAPPAKASQSIDPMFIVETGRGLVHANESGFRLLQAREGDLHAARAAIASMPELRAIVADENRECGEFFSGKTAADRRCYEVRANRAEGANGGVRVLTVQDVTARKESERRLFHEAHFDSLTGLANRRYFVRRLGEAIDRRDAPGTQRAALMLLDLDRFKEVNDSYGHPAGDELLRIIAHRLRQHLRREDYVAHERCADSWIARLGGDEFAILLDGFETREDLERVAQRVLRLVGDPVMLESRKLWMTGSLGIACYPEDAEDIADLTARADVALYKAKQEHRSGFQFYHPSLTVESQRKAALDRRLRGAIDEGELSLHYQAKVGIESCQILGAEALLRWDSKEHGAVRPKDFIPIAEEYGFIDRLGSWVIDRACAQISEWAKQGIRSVPISVNVSSLQFAQVDLLKVVADALARHEVDPSRLEIELTESAVLNGNDDKIVRCLDQLRSIGVKVSLDDFGTGYSALSYLSRIPLDAVKLDQTFIRDIHQNPASAGVVGAVVAMAHSLNLQVVAEGADCVEQLEVLRGSGCDLVQGFIFGPAVPADSFRELLRRGTMEIGGTLPAEPRVVAVEPPAARAATDAAHDEADDSLLPQLRESGEHAGRDEPALEVDAEDLHREPGDIEIESEADDVVEDEDIEIVVEADDEPDGETDVPAEPASAPQPADGYLLVVDDGLGNSGLLALRLNRLRFLALHAMVEEAALLANQEAERISTLVVSSQIGVEALRSLIRCVVGRGEERAAPSVIFIGDAPPPREHVALCADGQVWTIREPIDDTELVHVARMAGTRRDHRAARLRPRAAVDLMTRITRGGEAEPRTGVMMSLSSAGAFIACESLDVKSIVEIEFELEDGPVSVRAQVLYVRDEEESGDFGIGVGFVDIDEAIAARIEAEVATRSARCLA